MSQASVTSPGEKLRRMLAGPDLAMVPGCHDALGARLIESAGFEAVYISGFSYAASLGKPDVGIVTMSEVIVQGQRIAEAVTVPVITDADTGYGGPVNIWETVRGLERAGLGGLHLEDQRMPKKCGAMAGKELASEDEMTARLQVACRARLSPDFLIIGRTDAVTILGVEEAARRCRVMEAAGADAVMVPSLSTPAELETIARSVSIPVIYVAAETIRPMYSAQQLKAFGFAMALYPLSLIQVSVAAQTKLLAALHETGTTEAIIPEMTKFSEIGEIVGNGEAARIEQLFAKAR
ncbi:isocitrate lyase/PEP mutase family protein [Enterovirga aerilata]|uniref:Isocitrate lyase/PEP mutase family protein n=1 Tax=Enterovirga aerilata TaxID=2730920 RepID=A0A849I677_9HYPH|nr:isocitrate lyase/PEP mutase family protein [Enterovirga sp. DB1703]NNM71600.1 isocitrate lyase/PEP mutase family protein [Enterovirga sp. DB1703]